METKQEIFQSVARETEITISEKQWEDWRKAGVLPKFTRNGRVFEYPDGTARQVISILNLLKKKRSLNYVLLELWLANKNIDTDKLLQLFHSRLKYAIKVSRILNKLEQFINKSVSHEDRFYNFIHKLSTHIHIKLANGKAATHDMNEWLLHTSAEILTGNPKVGDTFDDDGISHDLGEATPIDYFCEYTGFDRGLSPLFSNGLSYLAAFFNLNAIIETANCLTLYDLWLLRWTINGWRVWLKGPDLTVIELNLTDTLSMKMFKDNLFNSDSFGFVFTALGLVRIRQDGIQNVDKVER